MSPVIQHDYLCLFRQFPHHHRIPVCPLDVILTGEEFINAGANTVGVHAEVLPHLHRTVQRIKELGARASVTLNPSTSVAAVAHILDQVDQILIMTVILQLS